jgi:predicted acetyltransferase
MPTVTLRAIDVNEYHRHFFPITEYAFYGSPPLSTETERLERQQQGILRRVLGVFEEEQAVAVASCIDMTQNVRGKIYPMGGIASVAALPQVRRQGYVRRLLHAHFAALHEQGTVFSGLYPFRESFYERLGYVTFPQVRIAKFAVGTLAPLLKWDIAGSVRLQTLKEGWNEFCAYTRAIQPQIHGMSHFPPTDAARIPSFEKQWLALAQHDGEIIGALTYRITDYRDKLIGTRWFYRHSHGKYLLLQWLARHMDQVRHIELELPAFETAETWLSDMDIQFSSSNWVTAMARVLNVALIGGMQVGSGAFTAQITDADCAWNNGSYRFASENGILQVTPATHADCTLTIQALSGLVYGTHPPHDFVWRGWGQGITPNLAATMQRLFPSAKPHMHEPY